MAIDLQVKKMAFCPKCDRSNWDSSEFCISCGAVLNSITTDPETSRQNPNIVLSDDEIPKISGDKELIVGILSFLPLAYLIIFIILMFALAGSIVSNPDSDLSPSTETLVTILAYLFFPISILMLSLIFNFIYYYVFRGDRVPKDIRIQWAILLIFINVFALPFFWYKYVWKNDESKIG